MKRREALRNTALMLGYAVSASTVAAVLNGCTGDSVQSSDTIASGPSFFTDEDLGLIAEMCETILPKTDTPGAKDVGVHFYVDMVLGKNTDLVRQQEFMEGFREAQTRCTGEIGKPFMECTGQQRHDFLLALDNETRDYLNRDSQDDNDDDDFRPFFARLKELALIGYFTCEQIGEEYLNYDPIPGVYHGCIPLTETGSKAWSL